MDCSYLETNTLTTLDKMRCGQALVVEFWHTRCVRCPAALLHMNQLAAQKIQSGNSSPPPVVFAACALATSVDCDAELQRVKDLLYCTDDDDESLIHAPHLAHLFMTFAQKEAIKMRFNFSKVPHCIILDADGTVVFSGPPDKAEEAIRGILSPM